MTFAAVFLAALVLLALSASSALAAKTHVLSATFGTGELALAEHSGIAVNQTSHDVYVADTGHGRVAEFEPNGTFVRGFGSLIAPTYIAVDNSGGGSAGDVYVADTGSGSIFKFEADGTLVTTWGTAGELTGFSELMGIAVGAGGDLFVISESETVDRFEADGTAVGTFQGPRGNAPAGLTGDAEGNLYKVDGNLNVSKFGPAGEDLAHTLDARSDAAGIAVDPSDDDLFVIQSGQEGQAAFVNRFALNCGEECEPVESFGRSEINGARAIAVDGASGTAYIATLNRVDVFSAAEVPEPTTGPAEDVVGSNARLTGTVNPEGLTVTGCEFDYGSTSSLGSTAPCVPGPAEIGTGSTPVAVHADVSGLQRGQIYHFLLSVSSAEGTLRGGEETFGTFPLVEAETVESLSSSTAAVSARIDAGGLATSYQVEYGPSVAYGSTTTPISIGAPAEAVIVKATLEGLEAGAEYHFRFVASSSAGSTPGLDATLRTPASLGAFGLPDGRAYELVSAENPGEIYIPSGLAQKPEDSVTEFPFRASADGEAVTYVGDPGEGSGNGLTGAGTGNQFLATRDPARRGWRAEAITPQIAGAEEADKGAEYQGFSADLSTGVLGASAGPFNTQTDPTAPAGCDSLYSRQATGFGSLITGTQIPGSCGHLARSNSLPTQNLAFAGGNDGTAGTAAFSERAFQSSAPLTPGSTESTIGGEGANLYVSGGGTVQLVSVLPDGSPDAGATFGAPPSLLNLHPDLSHVISADGSRIYFTDFGSGHIYLRENPTRPQSPLGPGDECLDPTDACTVAVSSGAATYWTASSDGSLAFYTEAGELWRFDATTGAREALVAEGEAGEPAGVMGVIGASEDGARVYLVAEAALTPGAEQRTCARPEGGTSEREIEEEGKLPPGRGCNLYLLGPGGPTFIAPLAAVDNELKREAGGGVIPLGAWQTDLGSRTALVTPDGGGLVFESTQRLTGYDNSALDKFSIENGLEVFVFRAATGSLLCASCDPADAPPIQPPGPDSGRDERGEGVTYLPVSDNPTFMRRWISADGNRVFFDSRQPLLAGDSNGVQDVYEWEREGTAGCPQATSVWGGCVFLLSGGDSRYRSYLIDASLSGDDVFFTHRGLLAGVGSVTGKNDLFDARVGGGFAEPQLGCTGSGCANLPAAPMPAVAPASLGLEGRGNVPAPKKKVKKHHRHKHHKKKNRHGHRQKKPTVEKKGANR